MTKIYYCNKIIPETAYPPDHKIIPIKATGLIEEGGSIHCSTMQVAK